MFPGFHGFGFTLCPTSGFDIPGAAAVFRSANKMVALDSGFSPSREGNIAVLVPSGDKIADAAAAMGKEGSMDNGGAGVGPVAGGLGYWFTSGVGGSMGRT